MRHLRRGRRLDETAVRVTQPYPVPLCLCVRPIPWCLSSSPGTEQTTSSRHRVIRRGQALAPQAGSRGGDQGRREARGGELATATTCPGAARLFPSAVGEPSWCRASALSQDPRPPTDFAEQSVSRLSPPLRGRTPLGQAPSSELSHRSGRAGHGARCAGNDLAARGHAVRLHCRPSTDRSVCSLLCSRRPRRNGSSQAGRPAASEHPASCRDRPRTHPGLGVPDGGCGETALGEAEAVETGDR